MKPTTTRVPAPRTESPSDATPATHQAHERAAEQDQPGRATVGARAAAAVLVGPAQVGVGEADEPRWTRIGFARSGAVRGGPVAGAVVGGTVGIVDAGRAEPTGGAAVRRAQSGEAHETARARFGARARAHHLDRGGRAERAIGEVS